MSAGTIFTHTVVALNALPLAADPACTMLAKIKCEVDNAVSALFGTFVQARPIPPIAMLNCST